MFTRMAKGLLWLMVLAIVIMAFVVAIKLDAGFWGFVATLIFGAVAISSFGMFVEIANNVMDIKNTLNKQNK